METSALRGGAPKHHQIHRTISPFEVCWTADMDPKILGFVHFLLFMTTLDTFCHPNAPRSWEYLIRRLQEPHEPPPFHHYHTSAALSLKKAKMFTSTGSFIQK